MSLLVRAMGYPYDIPKDSYLLVDGCVYPWPQDIDLSGRTPVLACGSNQSPTQLQRKFATGRVPVMAGWLEGYDSVYSAHITTYGSIAATYSEAPSVTSRQMVTWLDDAQLTRMHETEALGQNYRFSRLSGSCFIPDDRRFENIRDGYQYESLHGCVMKAGAPISLQAIPAQGRTFTAMDQETLQHWVLDQWGLDCPIEEFVAQNIENEAVRHARTQRLKTLK